MAKKPSPGEPTLPTLDPAPPASQPGAAPRFEYEVLHALADDAELLPRLNERGAAGWQAFAVTALGEHRGGTRLAIFLRREVRA